MVIVSQLKRADAAALKDINVLVRQLSERLPKCSMKLLREILANKNLELWVVRDGKHIVGMGTLVVVLIPEGARAQIEDVVVHEEYRGRGLGEKISKKLIERAKKHRAISATLSSRSERTAANKLYQKLGFTRWETNVYRLKL